MKTPAGIIITFVIVAIMTIIITTFQSHEQGTQKGQDEVHIEQEDNALSQFEKDVYDAIDELHKIYLYDYKSAIRVIKDYSYSDDFRLRYIREVDALMGYDRYMTIYHRNESFYDVIEEIETNEYEDRRWLYVRAASEVSKWLKEMIE